MASARNRLGRILASTGIAALSVLAPAASAQTQSPPSARPMGRVDFPAFVERTLPGGARLLVVTQNEVPFVTVKLVLRGGSGVDRPDQIGTAAFVAELLTKGTPTRTADDIAGAIDFVGGSLRASASTDWVSVSLGVLQPDLPAALDLLADVVMHPTFPDAQLELVRTRAQSGLEASLGQPAVLASRAFVRAIYGAHPYGKLETPETLQAIDRTALRAFHELWFRPSNAFFVVAGSVGADEAAAAIGRAFADWAPAAVPAVTYGQTPEVERTHVIVVHQPGSVQAAVRVGHLLPRGDAADWTALAVANQVLGGGSSGRLFKILREQKGWTYGAYSAATRRPDLGVWQATLDARSEVVVDAIGELIAQIGRMRTQMVPGSELDVTKSFLVGSFPLQIETPEQIAGQVLNNRLLGLPDDALETYRERVAALDASDVRQASAERLDPDHLVIVVVGDAVLLADALRKFGPVSVVDAEGRPLDTTVLLAKPSGERFDASMLRPGAFEYRVMLQGNAVGTMKRELAADTTGGRAMAFRGTVTLGPQTIDQEVVFGIPDFDARSATMSMDMAGQRASMDARVRDGRLIGTVALPSGNQPVNREIPPGALIADMVEIAVWIADLAEGKEIRVAVARLETGGVDTQVMRVRGIEDVTVPAGTFKAYRVEIAGSEPQTVWARVAAPHVILKLAPAGQPLTLELVALPPG